MSAAVNKVIILGHLGSDPEIRYTPTGQAVANFRVATTDSWTDKAGKKTERTEWHRIVVWAKTAELCGEYLTKGSQVYLEGRLQTREWTDKQDRKVFTTEVVADRVVFLTPSRKGAPRREEADDFGAPASGFDAPQGGKGPNEDDIPF